jgi:hypothetical protein
MLDPSTKPQTMTTTWIEMRTVLNRLELAVAVLAEKRLRASDRGTFQLVCQNSIAELARLLNEGERDRGTHVEMGNGRGLKLELVE